jgi:hypothetical protein
MLLIGIDQSHKKHDICITDSRGRQLAGGEAFGPFGPGSFGSSAPIFYNAINHRVLVLRQSVIKEHTSESV